MIGHTVRLKNIVTLVERHMIQLGEKDGITIDVRPDSDFVEFRMGDQKEIVKKAALWAAVFAMADAKTQADMMPVRSTEVETFERIHKVKATKLIKPGETLKFRCTVNVPVTVTEGLKGIIEPKKKSSFILPGGLP